jgi:Stage II sporulation protein E (SpoIIE)
MGLGGRGTGEVSPDTDSQHRFRRRRAWIITLSAMAITLAATILISSFSRASYQQNEQRLTTLQTRLTGLLLASGTLQVTSQLDRVAGLSAESGDPVSTFKSAMAPLMEPKGRFTSASLVLVTSAPTMLVHLGAAPLTSPTSSAAIARYEQAAHSPSLVVTRAVSGRLQRFGFLVSARGAAGTYVAAAGAQLPSSRHVTLPASSPDAVLNFALYYGTTPSQASLIETNAASLPIGGTAATEVIPFGTAHLTLVASPRVSLAGAWSQDLPWAILIVGIFFTLAVGVFARRLAFRRSDAEDAAEASQRLYDEQSKVSKDLQLALLPKKLPLLEGTDLSARYLPATRALEVGGDWYSAIKIDENRFAFVVGDVSGHGLSAATAMAPLRFTVGALAKLGLSPAAILQQADTEIDLIKDDHFATVLVGVVDIAARTCTLASAGHPLPLLVTDGRCDQLELPVGPPLGVHLSGFTESEVPLPPAVTLVAFTDGLVEQRGESLQARIDRLRQLLASRPPTTAEAAVERALGLTENAGHEDDIAVIAIRMAPGSVREGALEPATVAAVEPEPLVGAGESG